MCEKDEMFSPSPLASEISSSISTLNQDAVNQLQ